MSSSEPTTEQGSADGIAAPQASIEETAEHYTPTGADYVSDRDFVDFPISAEVARAILEMGYRTATPVQAATIEPALAGKDMLVRAKTGTGKTAAFCIPIVERIADGERRPKAVILSPTRELAQQTADEITGLTKYRDITHVCLVGGVPIGPQEKLLADGASIIVGTPGRIIDHVRRGNLNLSAAEIACLDEADEMLSMGFYEDVTSILDMLPADSQKLLFSATISPATERVINKYMRSPDSILLSTDADQVEGIEHVLYESPPGQHKVRSLLYLLDLENPHSAIIFCNTREDAATVSSFLDRQGLDVQLLSGELPQARRNKVIGQVKRGEVRFLVATDVAARGLDISDLSHVIQYSLPQDPSIYLHRTGRTGRIGKKGTALALVGGPDIGTRRTLENQHHIKFVEKAFPEPEECLRRRVDRQAEQIREAMGSLVFESYLPTARALMAREGGDALIAAALRAFFQWDRTRRIAMGQVEEAEEVVETRVEAKGRRPLLRDREERKARPERSERSERPERSERRDKPERRDRGERDRIRKPVRQSPLDADLDDLDALLVEDSTVLLDVVDGDAALTASDDAGDDKKKRKRRRRKKKGSEDDSSVEGEETESAAVDFDLDDALLFDEGPTTPAPAAVEAKPAAKPAPTVVEAKPAAKTAKTAKKAAKPAAVVDDLDLDAALQVDAEEEAPKKPRAKRTRKPKEAPTETSEPAAEISDLDALLSLD